jgi:hypothetical protein
VNAPAEDMMRAGADLFSLRGRTAFVTGSSLGLGR